jgi:hypothetical protein
MSAPREPDERGANGQKTCDRLGFPVNKDNGCPLFAIEPTVNNVGDRLAIVKRVTQNQVVETSWPARLTIRVYALQKTSH